MTLPWETPLLFTNIVLNGVLSPGTVTITGHDRPKKWDVQSAKGSTGASNKLQGDDPGTFTCAFYLAGDFGDDPGSESGGPSNQDDFARWEDFQKLIESSTNGKKPAVLSIYHPDLLRQGFTDCVNAGVSGLVHDGKGGATVTVKFIEYRPAKPKPTAAAGPRIGTTTVSAPDPNAGRKAQLDALVAQAKAP